MSPTERAQGASGADRPPLLRRLAPSGGEATAAQLVEELGLWQRPHPAAGSRPFVVLNMVASADGRASLHGRSAALSGPADRALFHALRSAADAVMAGAGTVRMERYGPIVRDPQMRRVRRERGLAEQPLGCIVSGRLALEPDIPLLAAADSRVVIVTPSETSVPGAAAAIDYVRARRDGVLDLPGAMVQLRERHGVQVLLCEGGPHLSTSLFAGGLVDELFLSISPQLAGGEPMAGEPVRILAGPELEPPVGLELRSALRSGSYLFLRYAVSARERASRETTLKSSLAR